MQSTQIVIPLNDIFLITIEDKWFTTMLTSWELSGDFNVGLVKPINWHQRHAGRETSGIYYPNFQDSGSIQYSGIVFKAWAKCMF